MEIKQINEVTKLVKIDKDSFLKDNEKVINTCLTILASYEKDMPTRIVNGKRQVMRSKKVERAKNFLYSASADIFMDGTSYFYILFRRNTPVSFCIYSSHLKRENAYILEMIYTNKAYTNCGYGTLCLEHSLYDMKSNNNAKDVVLTVNNKNESSLHMHNKILANKLAEGKALKEENVTRFYYDLNTLNLEKDPESTM